MPPSKTTETSPPTRRPPCASGSAAARRTTSRSATRRNPCSSSSSTISIPKRILGMSPTAGSWSCTHSSRREADDTASCGIESLDAYSPLLMVGSGKGANDADLHHHQQGTNDRAEGSAGRAGRRPRRQDHLGSERRACLRDDGTPGLLAMGRLHPARPDGRSGSCSRNAAAERTAL